MSRSFAMTMVVTMGLPVTAVAQQPTAEPDAYLPNRNQPTQQSTADPADTPQRREANYRGDQQQKGASQTANAELVNYLAAKMMLANQCEIEAADLAAQRAESSDVKSLANKIRQSHDLLNKQLVQAMPGLKSVEGLASTSSGLERTNRTNAASREYDADSNARNRVAGADSTSRDAFLDGAAQQLIDIHRRAVQNNHQMVKAELSEKQGAEFDRCFVNQQVGAHMWMLAELKAMQDVGPSQFASLVQESERQVKTHLDAAKQLAKQLEQQAQDAQAGAASEPRTRVRNF